jgi:hypothetical protein
MKTGPNYCAALNAAAALGLHNGHQWRGVAGLLGITTIQRG